MQTGQQQDGSAAPTLVVGIGASEGGLDAFKQFLQALPVATRMVFIFVHHQSEHHLDFSPDGPLASLASHTALPVLVAKHDAVLAPGTIYVVEPDAYVGLKDGRLQIGAPLLRRELSSPVDHLFRSMARALGSKAAGIVLSGAGRDGTAGMRSLKNAGGLTLVQAPETAAQTGMIESAVEAGVVDVVLPVAKMPELIERSVLLHGTIIPSQAATEAGSLASDAPGSYLDEETLQRLATILQEGEGGNKFYIQHYKPATVHRRFLRRMGLAGFAEIPPYLDYLGQNTTEQQALIRDLLIGFTAFFRDGEAFDVLKTKALAPIVEEAGFRSILRIWVPGCATGEEAYSVAIACLEVMQDARKDLQLQIFATDMDEEALAVARAGIYSPSSVENLSEERLAAFFVPVPGRGFQVNARLRNAVSFAVHDLCSDPPFSRMDLISCRNVLIYFYPHVQETVLRALHFGLKPNGFLFLGPSESLGNLRELFTVLSKTWRLFRRAAEAKPKLGPAGSARDNTIGSALREWVPARLESMRSRAQEPSIAELARTAILHICAPPAVVVAADGRVVYTHGELGAYLHYPKGEPRFDLLTVLREDLVTRVRAALYQCRRDMSTVRVLSSPDSDPQSQVTITASPATQVGEGAVVLRFEPTPAAEQQERPAAGTGENVPEHEAIIEQLERELHATREDLRNTVEELEISNEELRTSNEESMSINEELQSANEELEATTEELRSLNEELVSVNNQLRDKVEQLELARSDLLNFFASTKLATMFLDESLRIKRLTPAAESLLRLSRGDYGRFIGDIARELLQSQLAEDAGQVFEHLIPRRREVTGEGGRIYVRNVLPYRTESRHIEGVVVTWMDVTELKQATQKLAVRERQQAVIARLGLRALESNDLTLFMEQVVREVQQTLDTDLCKILELQPDRKSLLLKVGLGWNPGCVGSTMVSAGPDSQAGYTLSLGSAVVVDNLAAEKRFAASPLLQEHGVVSGISCVMSSHDGEVPYGVLGAHTRAHRAFTDDDANFLQAVANVLANAISRRQMRQRLAIERGVAKALSETRDLLALGSRLFTVFEQELGACVAELWRPEPSGQELVCEAYFTTDEPYQAGELRRLFDKNQRFARHAGMVGRVWALGQPEWLSNAGDESMFARAPIARELGLRSGFVFPFICEREVCGVFSVLTRRQLIPDRALIHNLETVGRSVGEFLRRMGAEQEMRSSEERLRIAVDAAAAMVYETEIAGDRILYMRGVEQLFGQGIQTPVSASWWLERIHPDDRGRCLELLEETKQGKQTAWLMAYRMRHSDGHYIHLEDHGRLIAEGPRQPRRVGVLLDVSERRRAEEIIRDSERRMTLAVRALDAGVFEQVFNPAPSSGLHLGDRWLAIVGYRREELPPAPGFLRWLLDVVIEAADKERFSEAYSSFIEGRSRKLDLEVKMRDKQGRLIWGRWIADASERNDTGQVVRLTGLLWDVTLAKEAEERLQQSEKSFRTLAESLPHLVWAADKDGTTYYCNARVFSFLGRSPDDMFRPNAWLEITHPDDRAAAALAWNTAIDTKAEYRCDTRLLRAADGAYLWHAAHAVPMRDEGGKVIRWFGTATNIHERKVAEDRLRASELRLQRTFESSPLGIAFGNLDGRITRCNDALLSMLGYDRNDELTYLAMSPPEFAARDRAALERLRGSGQLGPEERALLRKDKSRITALLSAAIIGVEDEYVLFLVDITAQKRAEIDMSKLAAIVESSNDAILSKDVEGIIQSWNRGAQELYGYSAEEIVGRAIDILVPPELTEEQAGVMARLRRGERIEQYETVRLRKDGRRIEVSVTISPLRDRWGQIIGASAVARDITERKRTEAMLHEADRQKNEFLAMLGHELRNPLAAIRSASELLVLSQIDDERVRRTQGVLSRQTAHMAKLIDGLLDISRIVRGKITLDKEVVDVMRILRNTLQDQGEQIERCGLTLVTDMTQEPVWVLGDQVRLTQVFNNLLANAIKFTKEPGTITVMARSDSTSAVIVVRDTGVGIDSDFLPKVFQPFLQAAQPLDRTTGGLGLGLALVKGIVALHDGEVSAHSAGLGHGAEFVVRLPTTQAPSEKPAPRRAAQTGRRLLVVEDNVDMAELLRDLLLRAGHEVAVAHSGEQALAVARDFAPEVILCDIGLPHGMSGYELAQAIRTIKPLKDAFLVAVTGYGRPEDRKLALAAGFDAHLTKPVDVTQIHEMLARQFP